MHAFYAKMGQTKFFIKFMPWEYTGCSWRHTNFGRSKIHFLYSKIKVLSIRLSEKHMQPPILRSRLFELCTATWSDSATQLEGDQDTIVLKTLIWITLSLWSYKSIDSQGRTPNPGSETCITEFFKKQKIDW